MWGKTPKELVEHVFPITRARIYHEAGVIITERESQLKYKYTPEVKRGKITKMSAKSNARLIATIQVCETTLNSMMTLTYPEFYPTNGGIVKSDLHWYTQWLKKRFDTSYLWFLEFQERGAPHMHILLEQSEITPRMRVEAGLKWTERIALSDWFVDVFKDEPNYRVYNIHVMRAAKFNTHETFWEVLRDAEGAKRYVTKYAAKQMQKKVPDQYRDVGRFWGCSKQISNDLKDKGVTVDITDDEIRSKLKADGHTVADWEVIPKYIFNVPF